MRRDYLIAIILALAAIPVGVVLMVAPEYLHLTGSEIPVAFWSGIGLSTLLIGSAVAVALNGEAGAPRQGHRARMIAIIGMVVFGAGFILCAIWFFSQRPMVSAQEQNPDHATLEVATGGEIFAKDAEFPNDLPFTFGRAETGGRIVLDGLKVINGKK
jgi:MFS family permease